MSDATTSDSLAEPYLANYIGGPLDGTTELRSLVDGEPESSISQVALVEGTEGIFWYRRGESNELNGRPQVRYTFDAGDSDALEGDVDRDDESKAL